ncbi:hypothetical protein GQ53DRAFT_774396 [Thozetella sp. PMI_491]|nr:hypothetical protein GQ53DRAFT_774396 [Thozetella sp. PMI_491]
MGSIGGLSPGGSIALGIFVGLLSTGVQSLGLTLQRKSHILEDEKGPYDTRRPPYRRRRWQVGMGMFIISNVLGSSVQISTLPLPVLSTLQASGLVFNSICATLILGEPFTRWSLWGTLLVCAGAVLIAVFGAIPSPAHTLKELLDLLGRRPFLIWMSFQALIVVSIAVATEAVSHFTNLMQYARFRLARGFAYGSISGILSAHSLLVAKSAVELIVRTIADGDNQFVHWQSWMLVLGLVTLALSQLYYLHRGLKLVSTSVLYPLIFCIYNIIAILDGLIYFRQTDLINPLRACLITLGTVILLSGVLALSWRLSDEQHSPGVGQSTLAPGLGLVEDTDGEEEEEELLLGSDLGDENEDTQPTQYNYRTFGGARQNGGSLSEDGPSSEPAQERRKSAKSITPSLRTTASRWAERAEIWDTLEDRDTPDSPLPSINRRRSTTLSARRETSSLLGRRNTSGPPSLTLQPSGSGDQLSSPTPRRVTVRRRRKSTGFPGFTPRKSTRKPSGGGLQNTIDGIWRLRWWGNKGKKPAAGAGPDDAPRSSSDGFRWPRRYRDDPEAAVESPEEPHAPYRDSVDEPRPPPATDSEPNGSGTRTGGPSSTAPGSGSPEGQQ